MKRYLAFARTHGISPLPINESVISRYVGYLDLQGLAPSTIKMYLAALRAWMVSIGLDPPLIWTPRVQLMLKAISRAHSPPRQAAPIGYDQLALMINCLSSSRDHLIIASSITLQYFACLRASELCADLQQATIPLRSHISFQLHSSPPTMTFRVISSKTNPHGFTVHVGCSHKPVCAVCITYLYLHSHPIPPAAPLYQFSSGQYLTYSLYNSLIKQLTSMAGLDPTNYSSHSLRAGAATQAARAGLPREDIKR